MSTSSPIADLSYRNYDGPLASAGARWWVIAKMTMHQGTTKKGFWFWSALSAYWYLILAAVFYFMDTLSVAMPNSRNGGLLGQIIWKDQFLNAFSISQLLLFIVALMVGAGTIAGDNRANALLVYLSKPCTKLDYLFGKWLGIFLVIFAVSALPMTVFFAYCKMSYASYGFGEGEQFFYLKLLAMSLLPAGLHASLCVGVSSLFKQGRLAGATYAGLYFITLFFTEMMRIVYLFRGLRTHNEQVTHLVGGLFYCSVDGMQIGLAKVLLGTAGSPIFPGGGGGRHPMIPEPDALPFLLLYLGICVASVLIAYRRVQAVEVIRG